MDPARPLLTHVDIADGTRVELSAVTLANNVAKTAGLLGDELGVMAGGTVGMALVAHWNVAVWAMGVWSLGAAVRWLEETSPDITGCDAVAASPEHIAAVQDARELVVVSRDPFGGPCRVPLPPGALDWSVAMRSHPDVLVPRDLRDEPVHLMARYAGAAPAGARVLVATRRPERVVSALLSALVGGGSLVLVTGGEASAHITSQERVDRTLPD